MFKRRKVHFSTNNRIRNVKIIRDNSSNLSTSLFSIPSFWIGAGSILNFAGSYYDYNYSKSDQEADFRAFVKDWCAVYNDLNTSFNKLQNKKEDSVLVS